MSSSKDTAALLDQLENERATGCLTISSAEGLVSQVYLLYGRVFHATGPNTEGEAALKESLSWSDVGLSFDPKAQLPTKQTVELSSAGRAVWIGVAGPASSGSALEAHVLRRPSTLPEGAVRSLNADPRLAQMSLAGIAGGCLSVLVPFAIVGIGALVSPNVMDGWLIVAVIAFAVMTVLSVGAYLRFRSQFFCDAVTVPGALPPNQIPRIVGAPAGVITGQPELVIKTRTRSTVGELGKCWIELYPDGLQISKGPERAEPRWEFAYKDIVQAEVVDISSTGRGMTTHRYSVRIITSQPRMAFLLGGSVFQNSNTRALAGKLREHKVTLLNEEFSF